VIALDTNILIRLLLDDDSQQTETVVRFIDQQLSEAGPGWVAAIVIVELIWVMERTYGRSRAEISASLRNLLDAREIRIEHDVLLREALALPAEGIADALIHLIGKAAGCSHTVTFDQRFARLPGVELLA
jgi:predicted nucleic-acid-binding protein